MTETTMTDEQRQAVQATIDAGDKVWMVMPDGPTIGFKCDDDAMQWRQVEMRIAAGYKLTTAPAVR